MVKAFVGNANYLDLSRVTSEANNELQTSRVIHADGSGMGRLITAELTELAMDSQKLAVDTVMISCALFIVLHRLRRSRASRFAARSCILWTRS